MSAPESVLRKIQKCLALSRSSNPNEASSALRQAQALMRQHDLTEAMVHGLEVTGDVVRTREGFGSCVFLSELGGLMRDAFGVVSVMERNPGSANRANIRYIGQRGRAQLAVYSHRVIVRAVDAAWTEHLRHFPKHKGDGGKRTAFRLGWLVQVRAKVMAIGFSDEEREAIQAYQARTYGTELAVVEPPKIKLTNEEFRVARVGAALADASGFEIHRPMEADARPELAALEHLP